VSPDRDLLSKWNIALHLKLLEIFWCCFVVDTAVAVVGLWSAWMSWSDCLVPTCGRGVRLRSRECSNPSPIGLGKTCVGASSQQQLCPGPPCPGCCMLRACKQNFVVKLWVCAVLLFIFQRHCALSCYFSDFSESQHTVLSKRRFDNFENCNSFKRFVFDAPMNVAFLKFSIKSRHTQIWDDY